ncbi:MAG TPA: ABC transporter permease [Miltoncostaeaceae bacterium]|nr:ABC transporter permease [Miltoncostaeaceae bacterium]
MSGALNVAAYALRESVRRRVFVVVLILSLAFLGLFWWGAGAVFREVGDHGLATGEAPVRTTELAGGFLLGMAMFAILFLGTVLAIFLTLNAIRGDAERGLLQQILVRPVSRTAVIGGRFLAAFVVCAAYVALMFIVCALLVRAVGGWSPAGWIVPVASLIGAIALITSLSLLGSVFLAGTSNGIAVFMLVGAGMVGGLLGQIGEAISSPSLRNASAWVTRLLPFEALYQGGLYALNSDLQGLERVVINLGPFGGAVAAGAGMWLWAGLYLVTLWAAAVCAFLRRDL